jgi:hypothetical protein
MLKKPELDGGMDGDFHFLGPLKNRINQFETEPPATFSNCCFGHLEIFSSLYLVV